MSFIRNYFNKLFIYSKLTKLMIVDYDLLEQKYINWVVDKSRIQMIQDCFTTYDMRARSNVPFNLFPRQKDFLYALRDYQNNVTTKPRQAGITTCTAAFLACECALAAPESPETILVIGNKIDLAQQMVEKIKAFLWQVPRWVWGNEYYNADPKHPNNKKDIFTTCNKSELVLFNGCKVIAKSSGQNAARGVSSVSWLVFDEAAFIEHGDVVYSQAVATTSTGGHVIMISTPNGRDVLYYKTYEQAKLGKNGFHITELKWYQDPRYNKFLKWIRTNKDTKEVETYEEEYLDKTGTITHDEKHWKRMESEGWKATSPWYVNMCGKFNNNEQRIAQELDVSFLGSANNVVSPELIEMHEKMNVQDPDPELKDDFVPETWIWKPPIKGHRYVMGVDSGRGDGEDTSVIEIIDLDAIDENGFPTFEQVLEYQGLATGDVVGQLAYRYGMMYGQAFAVFDAIGGYGDAAILQMLALGYKNLYYDDAMLNKYMMQVSGSKLMASADGKMPGFHSGAVRTQMLSNLANMIRNNEIKIRSNRTIYELGTWVYINGKMDHQHGSHDDTITCLAMVFFVFQHSLSKIQEVKEMDAMILKSWSIGSNTSIISKNNDSINMRPNNMIFGIQKSYTQQASQPNPAQAFMWVLGRVKN